MFASIPSPDVGTLSVGPLNLRLYGLMVALGVIAAVYVAARALQRRGLNPDWVVQVATLGVPMGLIGARAYHVLTDWKSYQGRWVDVLKIWEGGLGIPGGIVGGVLGGLIVVRLRDLPLRPMLDATALGLPVGQVIGRLGNWFNQELFGRPTDLPWGLEIDRQHRPPEYIDDETFHPAFAYEMVWNLLVFGVLWRTDRRGRLPRGHLMVLYLFCYSAGRLWIEALRVDSASLLAGVRVNIWVMGGVLVLSGLFLALVTPRRARVEAAGIVEPEVGDEAEPDAAAEDADPEPETPVEAEEPAPPESAPEEPRRDATEDEPAEAAEPEAAAPDEADEAEAPAEAAEPEPQSSDGAAEPEASATRD